MENIEEGFRDMKNKLKNTIYQIRVQKYRREWKVEKHYMKRIFLKGGCNFENEKSTKYLTG